MLVSVHQNQIDPGSSLLYSPFNSIAEAYGSQTLQAFEELRGHLDEHLTARQLSEFGTLKRYLVTDESLRPLGSMWTCRAFVPPQVLV